MKVTRGSMEVFTGGDIRERRERDTFEAG